MRTTWKNRIDTFFFAVEAFAFRAYDNGKKYSAPFKISNKGEINQKDSTVVLKQGKLTNLGPTAEKLASQTDFLKYCIFPFSSSWVLREISGGLLFFSLLWNTMVLSLSCFCSCAQIEEGEHCVNKEGEWSSPLIVLCPPKKYLKKCGRNIPRNTAIFSPAGNISYKNECFPRHPVSIKNSSCRWPISPSFSPYC